MRELVSTVGFLRRLCCRWIPPALPLQEFNKSPDREKSMATTFAAGRGRVRLLDFSVKEANVVVHQMRHKKCDWIARDFLAKSF